MRPVKIAVCSLWVRWCRFLWLLRNSPLLASMQLPRLGFQDQASWSTCDSYLTTLSRCGPGLRSERPLYSLGVKLSLWSNRNVQQVSEVSVASRHRWQNSEGPDLHSSVKSMFGRKQGLLQPSCDLKVYIQHIVFVKNISKLTGKSGSELASFHVIKVDYSIDIACGG